MLIRFFLFIMIVLGLFRSFLNTLVSIGGLLLVLALLVTIIVAILSNSWFSFILFLIYVTGLLVLFRYILAISPNYYYNSSFKKFFFKFWLILVIICFVFIRSNGVRVNSVVIDFEEMVILIFNLNRIVIYLLIGVILLIVLVLVVNICYKRPRPLRPFL